MTLQRGLDEYDWPNALGPLYPSPYEVIEINVVEVLVLIIDWDLCSLNDKSVS